jgi:hypothetical protein
MATLMDKQQKANIQSMLGIIAIQVQDDQLKEAEENLQMLTKVIRNARNEMNGLDLHNKVTRFDVDQL